MAKYLIWDFDGTLGYREGAWRGAMEEVLRRYAPDCTATRDEIRPYIQYGFRWHEPHQAYPLQSASLWWSELEPIFEQAYQAVGIAPQEAKKLARQVRSAYTSPANWRLYDDTLPTLTQLSEAGWTHLLLSNHVPELSSLLRHLEIDGVFARVFNSVFPDPADSTAPPPDSPSTATNCASSGAALAIILPVTAANTVVAFTSRHTPAVARTSRSMRPGSALSSTKPMTPRCPANSTTAASASPPPAPCPPASTRGKAARSATALK